LAEGGAAGAGVTVAQPLQKASAALAITAVVRMRLEAGMAMEGL
jgi:hypothetical protein